MRQGPWNSAPLPSGSALSFAITLRLLGVALLVFDCASLLLTQPTRGPGIAPFSGRGAPRAHLVSLLFDQPTLGCTANCIFGVDVVVPPALLRAPLKYEEVFAEAGRARVAPRSAQATDQVAFCAGSIPEWGSNWSTQGCSCCTVPELSPLPVKFGQVGSQAITITNKATCGDWHHVLCYKACLVWAMLCAQTSQGCVLPNVWEQSENVHCTCAVKQSAVAAAFPEEKNMATTQTARRSPRAQGKGSWEGQTAPATEDRQGQGQRTSASHRGPPQACSSAHYSGAEASYQQWTGDEEGDLLGALLAHIGDSGSLPTSLAERVQSFQATNARSTGKLLRKQVAQQTEARTQLQKLSKDRQLFLDGWAGYLQVLTDTVEQQVVKMSKVLEEFDTAEAQWQAQLSEATDLLSKASAGTSPAPKSNEAMDEEDTTVAQAAAEESRKRQTEKIQQGQKELIEALNKAKAAAEVQRDGSCAPRRRPKDDDVVDLERRPQ